MRKDRRLGLSRRTWIIILIMVLAAGFFDLLDHTLATESLYASSRFCRVAKLYGID